MLKLLQCTGRAYNEPAVEILCRRGSALLASDSSALKPRTLPLSTCGAGRNLVRSRPAHAQQLHVQPWLPLRSPLRCCAGCGAGPRPAAGGAQAPRAAAPPRAWPQVVAPALQRDMQRLCMPMSRPDHRPRASAGTFDRSSQAARSQPELACGDAADSQWLPGMRSRVAGWRR